MYWYWIEYNCLHISIRSDTIAYTIWLDPTPWFIYICTELDATVVHSCCFWITVCTAYRSL